MNAVATLTLPDLHATVAADGDTFVLWWTDYVANAWTETHPDLGTALARLAVLHHCVTHGEGFDVEPGDFVPVATAFLDASITMPAARSPTRIRLRRTVTRPGGRAGRFVLLAFRS